MTTTINHNDDGGVVWCTQAAIGTGGGCPGVAGGGHRHPHQPRDALGQRSSNSGTFTIHLAPVGNRSGDRYANNAVIRYSDAGVPPGGNLGARSNTVSSRVVASRIGDYSWKDTNKDGKQDVGEPVFAGVPVSLSGTDKFGRAISLSTTTGRQRQLPVHVVEPGRPERRRARTRQRHLHGDVRRAGRVAVHHPERGRHHDGQRLQRRSAHRPDVGDHAQPGAHRRRRREPDARRRVHPRAGRPGRRWRRHEHHADHHDARRRPAGDHHDHDAGPAQGRHRAEHGGRQEEAQAEARSPTPIRSCASPRRPTSSAPPPGRRSAITIVVRNVGESDAHDVRVCDDPSKGLVLVSQPRHTKFQDGKLCWSLQTMEKGSTKTPARDHVDPVDAARGQGGQPRGADGHAGEQAG